MFLRSYWCYLLSACLSAWLPVLRAVNGAAKHEASFARGLQHQDARLHQRGNREGAMIDGWMGEEITNQIKLSGTRAFLFFSRITANVSAHGSSSRWLHSNPSQYAEFTEPNQRNSNSHLIIVRFSKLFWIWLVLSCLSVGCFSRNLPPVKQIRA